MRRGVARSWMALVLLAALAGGVRAQAPQPVAPAPQPDAPAPDETPAEADAEADAEGEADVEADVDPETDPEAEVAPDANPQAEAEPEAEPDADTQAEADPDEVAPLADPPAEPALPAEHRPELALELQLPEGQDQLYTGDVLTLVLTADAPAADDLNVPRDQSFAPFEILSRDARTEARGERARHTFTLELLALEPGEHELRPMRVRVITPDGLVGEVETDARPIRVASVLGNEPDAQPKPPTEPVVVMEEDDTLWWVLGILGVIVATALLTWLFLRWWRKRQKELEPAPPPRPPWEVAIEKLEALRRDRDAAVAEGRVVEWVDGVSDAVREYLGGRYGFDGLESTTDEVLAELRRSKRVHLNVDEVAALLGDCDLVKFAQATFDEAQCDNLLAGAFRVVRTSAPRPEMGGARPPSASAPRGPVGASAAQPAAGAPLPDDHPDARWMPSAETPQGGAPDAGAADPSAADPSTADPSTGDPSAADPSAAGPGAPGEGSSERAAAAPASPAQSAPAGPSAGSGEASRWAPPAGAAGPAAAPESAPAEGKPTESRWAPAAAGPSDEAPASGDASPPRPIPQTLPPRESPVARPIPQTIPPAEGADTLPERRFDIPAASPEELASGDAGSAAGATPTAGADPAAGATPATGADETARRGEPADATPSAPDAPDDEGGRP